MLRLILVFALAAAGMSGLKQTGHCAPETKGHLKTAGPLKFDRPKIEGPLTFNHKTNDRTTQERLAKQDKPKV